MGKAKVFSRSFSHAWLSGVYQYEDARKLEFYEQAILFGLYSADLPLFHKAYRQGVAGKSSAYTDRFLFVGRLEAIKGLDTLLAARQQLGQERGDWKLHLIGNGSLRKSLATEPDIVHKFTDAGLPLIMSDVVGAATVILVPGMNGYVFKANDSSAD